MINVYDWYESFAVVLERQRNMRRAEGAMQASDGPAPPNKSGRKAIDARSDGNDVGERQVDHVEMSEEDWKLECQARFMRALHELDRLGFIKHTGRKADHVIRTVYDQLE
jgi:origin recognition complex subunit 3